MMSNLKIKSLAKVPFINKKLRPLKRKSINSYVLKYGSRIISKIPNNGAFTQLLRKMVKILFSW